MNLSDLNLLDLLEHMRHAEGQLQKTSRTKSYLDHARADTPIIDELADQIGLILREKSLPGRKKLMRRTHHIMLVLLALRMIEHEQQVNTTSQLQSEMN